MFVRFRQTQTRLQMSLIETCRIDGKVRHEHIAALGSISDELTISDRVAFWQGLHERLAKLSNRITPEDHGKVLAAIHARVPMVRPDEQQQVQRRNAEADARLWSSLAEMHQSSVSDHKALAVTVERAIAENKAAADEAAARADAAKERLTRIERGDEVSGGLGKPMTYDDAVAILKANGFTERDIKRFQLAALIDKFGASDELLEEARKRTKKAIEKARDAAMRDVLKKLAALIENTEKDDQAEAVGE